MTPDELAELARFCAQAEPEPRSRQFHFRHDEFGTPPDPCQVAFRTRSSARTVAPANCRSNTGRVLGVLRLVTLACAGVMLFSPDGYDHYHAAILAWLALFRP